jgi:hypothetical protein
MNRITYFLIAIVVIILLCPKYEKFEGNKCLSGCTFENRCYAKDDSDFDSCGVDADWADEKTCNSCPNCKWCIDSNYDGQCISVKDTEKYCRTD